MSRCCEWIQFQRGRGDIKHDCGWRQCACLCRKDLLKNRFKLVTRCLFETDTRQSCLTVYLLTRERLALFELCHSDDTTHLKHTINYPLTCQFVLSTTEKTYFRTHYSLQHSHCGCVFVSSQRPSSHLHSAPPHRGPRQRPNMSPSSMKKETERIKKIFAAHFDDSH